MTRTGRPKSDNPKTKELRVRTDNILYNAFSDKCEKLNINKSELIRKWIIAFLDNKKE